MFPILKKKEKVESQLLERQKDWTESMKLTQEAEELAVDIENLTTSMIEKYKKMNDNLSKAYQLAPMTDCGYGVSPIGQSRIIHALKCHMMKNQLNIDTGYLGDTTKFVNFSDYVKESIKWLYKFS